MGISVRRSGEYVLSGEDKRAGFIRSGTTLDQVGCDQGKRD